jgi:2-dehydro-3-deoxygluconokinase
VILPLRPASTCAYDLVSLGEVMLRLDPGEDRVRTARSFRVWEGGGEYNVARGLRRCFGLRTAILTALCDNDVGRLIEDLMLQGGVDTQFVGWLPFDGVGRQVRNGLNFTERGFGPRGALGVSDRGHSAASALGPGDFDWEHLFGRLGVRCLHTGGIFTALSPSTAALAEEAMHAARAHGTVISYDLNYRPSLWKAAGGESAARRVNRRLAPLVDIMLGNEEDFTACLGFEVRGIGADFDALDASSFREMIGGVTETYDTLSVVATTLRTVRSASVNDWCAVAWSSDDGFVEATPRRGLEVFDRVGGGDSFASGLLYGLLELGDLHAAVEYGAAHGALAMTTPGDTSTARLDEVRRFVERPSARIAR